MKLIDAIKSLKSVERYSDKKKPDWRKIIRAIDGARHAPSARGHFSMKFILVTDSSKIEKLKEATQQPFVSSAKYVVIAVTDDKQLVRSYSDRGVRYASRLGGAAIQNFLLALTEFGYVTKWIQYFYEDQVRNLFDIPDNLYIEGIFPIGIETKVPTHELKKPDLENIIYFDKWKNKKMKPVTKIRANEP